MKSILLPVCFAVSTESLWKSHHFFCECNQAFWCSVYVFICTVRLLDVWPAYIQLQFHIYNPCKCKEVELQVWIITVGNRLLWWTITGQHQWGLSWAWWSRCITCYLLRKQRVEIALLLWGLFMSAAAPLAIVCVWTGEFNQHPLLVVPAAKAEQDVSVEVNAARDLNISLKDTLYTTGLFLFTRAATGKMQRALSAVTHIQEGEEAGEGYLLPAACCLLAAGATWVTVPAGRRRQCCAGTRRSMVWDCVFRSQMPETGRKVSPVKPRAAKTSELADVPVVEAVVASLIFFFIVVWQTALCCWPLAPLFSS